MGKGLLPREGGPPCQLIAGPRAWWYSQPPDHHGSAPYRRPSPLSCQRPGLPMIYRAAGAESRSRAALLDLVGRRWVRVDFAHIPVWLAPTVDSEAPVGGYRPGPRHLYASPQTKANGAAGRSRTHRPTAYKAAALPTELRQRLALLPGVEPGRNRFEVRPADRPHQELVIDDSG